VRVNLIKEKTVFDFAKEHATSVNAFTRWVEIIKKADVGKPQDFVNLFGRKNVDLLGNNSDRICFDVGGNNYRIICSYYFNDTIETATLFVKWIGTHAEYDALNDQDRQYIVDKF